MATFQTSNGNTYEFSFERQHGGDIRAYITRMPSYGSRDTSLSKTHRHQDGNRHYVCWDEPIRSENDARKVAAGWAKRTERYIRTGEGFSR